MAHENNEVKNPYLDYLFTQGNDDDGVPYNEYNFTPPPLNDDDHYLRTLVDTRNNTIAHIATVLRSKNKHERSGSLVAYVTTRRGLFIHRVLLSGEDLRFAAVFPDERDPRRLQQLSDRGKEYRQRVLASKGIDDIPKYVIPERDPMGTRYDRYVMTQPQLQNGDTWLGTAPVIDKRECTVNHLAKTAQGKYGISSVLVSYVCNPLGRLLKREVLDADHSRIISQGLSKAIVDPERPNLDFDGDDPIVKPGTVLAAHVARNGGEVSAGNPPTEVKVTRTSLILLEKFGDAKMTLDRAVDIANTEDPVEKIKALETFINSRGGMDRLMEQNLSNALFGPAPGSQERARQADMDTAQRLSQPVIIDEMNYGRLAVSHIGGVPFVGDIDDLAELGLAALYISRTPKFIKEIKIFVTAKVGAQESVYPFYALEKEDINDLGRLLSKGRSKVSANFKAADLKVWVNGTVEREYTSPEEFFACTPEWIEQAKF